MKALIIQLLSFEFDIKKDNYLKTVVHFDILSSLRVDLKKIVSRSL